MRVTRQFTACLLLALCICVSHAQQKQAYLNVNRVAGSAVDARGLRHQARDYANNHAPWLDDRITVIAPKYPLDDLRLHHEGAGRFRLVLDLNSGGVKQVLMTQSTGFSSLDRNAIAALQQWRWKPGRWREVELRIVFTMSGSPPVARGAVKIPHH